MDLKNKTFFGNKQLHLNFCIKKVSAALISPVFVIGGMVGCRFRVEFARNDDCFQVITVSEKFYMLDECRKFMQLRIRSVCMCTGINEVENSACKISDETIVINDDWHYNGTVKANENKAKYDLFFDITIEEIIFGPTPFDVLHEDTTLTDFELCGEDGSINVHRSVLATSSPVLYTMLSGEWKETTKGKVELAGITKESLTNLKAFMYLKKLPYRPNNKEELDEMYRQLEELIKLACYLLMSDLVAACSAQFLLDLTPENFCKLTSLAGEYKLKALTKGLFLSYKHGAIGFIEEAKFSEDWI